MMHGDRPDVIMRFANAVSSEEDEMSIFPTKILLATDGSSESELATRTAVDLARMSDSELHVIHVLDGAPSPALLYPEAADPEGIEMPDPVLEEDRPGYYDAQAAGLAWERTVRFLREHLGPA